MCDCRLWGTWRPQHAQWTAVESRSTNVSRSTVERCISLQWFGASSHQHWLCLLCMVCDTASDLPRCRYGNCWCCPHHGTHCLVTWSESPLISNAVCLMLLFLAHSLTHCCTWPAEGRSDLHNEWSRVVNWQALMGTWPISSSTCWSQVLRGRPGGCFQSVAGVMPVKASVNRCCGCEAGVSQITGRYG